MALTLQRGRDPKVTEGGSAAAQKKLQNEWLQRGRDPKVTEGAGRSTLLRRVSRCFNGAVTRRSRKDLRAPYSDRRP